MPRLPTCPAYAGAVRYSDGAVTGEVTDDGRGAANSANGPSRPAGHGIAGMRERVAVFAGDFRAGPRPGGGFQVQARLPFETLRS